MENMDKEVTRPRPIQQAHKYRVINRKNIHKTKK